MRQYDAVFWHREVSGIKIHVPGRRGHRSYEYWTVTQAQVDGADRCMEVDNIPMRWMLQAEPPKPKARPKSLKGWGGKRSP